MADKFLWKGSKWGRASFDKRANLVTLSQHDHQQHTVVFSLDEWVAIVESTRDVWGKGSMQDSQAPAPLLLSAMKVAESLGISESMAYRMMADGTLPIVRIGRAVRVPAALLHLWVEQQTEGGK